MRTALVFVLAFTTAWLEENTSLRQVTMSRRWQKKSTLRMKDVLLLGQSHSVSAVLNSQVCHVGMGFSRAVGRLMPGQSSLVMELCGLESLLTFTVPVAALLTDPDQLVSPWTIVD